MECKYIIWPPHNRIPLLSIQSEPRCSTTVRDQLAPEENTQVQRIPDHPQAKRRPKRRRSRSSIIHEIHLTNPPARRSNENWKFRKDRWPDWNKNILEELQKKEYTKTSNAKETYQILYSALISAIERHFNRSRWEEPKPRKPKGQGAQAKGNG